MILGFKTKFPDGKLTNFKDMILTSFDLNHCGGYFDSKPHTIRIDVNNRWKTDKKIHFATGVRTKNYYCFKIGVCKSVQKIEMLNRGVYFCLMIDNISYSTGNIDGHSVIEKLALNDGFKNVLEFKKWFIPNLGDCYRGKIIHWTDLKY